MPVRHQGTGLKVFRFHAFYSYIERHDPIYSAGNIGDCSILIERIGRYFMRAVDPGAATTLPRRLHVWVLVPSLLLLLSCSYSGIPLQSRLSNQQPKTSTVRVMTASYYGSGDGFNGHKTASGERFDAQALTAAHKTMPFGTRLRVKNPKNGKSVTVRINDRGPYHSGRELDLSFRAAELLDITDAGEARVEVEELR